MGSSSRTILNLCSTTHVYPEAAKVRASEAPPWLPIEECWYVASARRSFNFKSNESVEVIPMLAKLKVGSCSFFAVSNVLVSSTAAERSQQSCLLKTLPLNLR